MRTWTKTSIRRVAITTGRNGRFTSRRRRVPTHNVINRRSNTSCKLSRRGEARACRPARRPIIWANRWPVAISVKFSRYRTRATKKIQNETQHFVPTQVPLNGKDVIVKVSKTNPIDLEQPHRDPTDLKYETPTFSSDVREAINTSNVKNAHCVEIVGIDDSHKKPDGSFEIRVVTEFVPGIRKYLPCYDIQLNIKALATVTCNNKQKATNQLFDDYINIQCVAKGMLAIHGQGSLLLI